MRTCPVQHGVAVDRFARTIARFLINACAARAATERQAVSWPQSVPFPSFYWYLFIAQTQKNTPFSWKKIDDMGRHFELPGTSCEHCNTRLSLFIDTEGINISALKIVCTNCSWEENLLEKGSAAFEANKKRVKEAAREISKSLLKLKNTLPKSREEWSQVVTNPKHPFTAALLSALLILLMELSGFGIFVVITWILANLILNPLGWFLVPLIVAIGFTYRAYFKQDKLRELKVKLAELERKQERGEISQEVFEAARDKLLSDYFE